VGKTSKKKRALSCEADTSEKERSASSTSIAKKDLFYKPIIHILLIAVVGLLAYSNTFRSPFQWDEDKFILHNTITKDLHYFLEPSSAKELPYYNALKSRYVGYLSFAINYKMNGPDVTGYHIVNIVIHIINGILVYFFLQVTLRTPFFRNRKSGGDSRFTRFISLFTALLFVAHPLQIEAVTYIFQRLASFMTMFYLLSLVMYIKGRMITLESEGRSEKLTVKSEKSEDGPLIIIHSSRFTISIIWYLVSFVSAVLAMKTKENAFTLPIIIMLYELFFFKGTIKKRFLYLMPFLLTLFIIPLTLIGTDKPAGEIIGQMSDPAFLDSQNVSRGDYLFTQFRVIATYIRLLFLPINQNVDYDYPLYHSFFNPEVLASFILLLLIFSAAVYLLYASRSEKLKDDSRFTIHLSRFTFHGYYRLIAFGIFWFFITLLVESSVIPIPMVIDEYRVYLPSVGIFAAIGSGMFLLKERSENRWLRRGANSSVVLMIILFLISTYARNGLWNSNVSLWQDAAEKSANKARPHYNLGLAYASKSLLDAAIEQYQMALRLNPDYTEAHNNLGTAYASQGQWDRAIEQYQMALRLNPDYTETHFNLGNAYASKGLLDAAIEQYQMALRLNPDYTEAHYNLGNEYASKGLLDRAIEQYQMALRLNPDYTEAHNNLGTAYASQGQWDRAIAEYQTALRLNPDYAEAHNNLGTAYASQGQWDRAIAEYQTALRLKPDFYEVRQRLNAIASRRH
jgi:protein O-mannosyl-transferase